MTQDEYIPGKIPYFGIPYDNPPVERLPHDWHHMTEPELLDYLRVRPASIPGCTTGGALVCHGPTLEWVRKFGANAERVLEQRGIAYTVREDEDPPEDGGPHWWRTISIDDPKSVEPNEAPR